ncbi:hypothetical protein CEXT_112941 [Caerostris extrusa]|uniref:Uncharacterized protein n=1 Tax=Caerostris extrusa TaxID=172846 RepID=A0AAV4QBA1_CAEEX|nr:hypothetical protein CEXT_112941 [Caerostris extrusa]
MDYQTILHKAFTALLFLFCSPINLESAVLRATCSPIEELLLASNRQLKSSIRIDRKVSISEQQSVPLFFFSNFGRKGYATSGMVSYAQEKRLLQLANTATSVIPLSYGDSGVRLQRDPLTLYGPLSQ